MAGTFANQTAAPSTEMQKEALDALDAARIRLDDVRSRAPERLVTRIGSTRLKRTYGSREVAAITGLTARQLQLWEASGLDAAGDSFAAHRRRRIHRTAIFAD